MATCINDTTSQPKVGLLFIVGDLVSNEQRKEVVPLLSKALKQIDKKNFAEIEPIFNELIQTPQFRTGSKRFAFFPSHTSFVLDSQYRQITSTDKGSSAGFLYLPTFHTVSNVLRDYLTSCSRLSIIFLGKRSPSIGSRERVRFFQVNRSTPTAL
jgi:hypothetical protein